MKKTNKKNAIAVAEDDTSYAIRVRNLTKIFRIYDSPMDLIKERLTGRGRHTEYTALEDVSLDIRHGETVGIIGRNGAGKSTLLKIISGVLDHDFGDVQVNGKVSALLELGSGFNLEYSGRENILLGGMCLGMSRQEILEKTDAIIEFSELQDAIDQPLKTYSSGMHSRLAFATASSVDAEILIVDEALAVGDMFFQSKCMARMRKMQEAGTTILFVSHSPSAVKEMCDRGILLDKGKLLLDSDTIHVTERYFNMALTGHEVSRVSNSTDNAAMDMPTLVDTDPSQPPEEQEDGLSVPGMSTREVEDMMPALNEGVAQFDKHAGFERVQSGKAHFVNLQLVDEYGKIKDCFDYGESAALRMVVEVDEPIDGVMFSYVIRTTTGVDVVWADTRPMDIDVSQLLPGNC